MSDGSFDPPGRRGRRRAARMVLAAVLLVGLAAVTVSGPPASASAPRDVSGVARQHHAHSYAVGRRSLTFVDETRPTAANPERGWPARPDRTIPVLVLYPAPGDAAVPVTDARPAPGRFPLVVFSHGFLATGPIYETFVAPWVRAGYVVALPTFPLSNTEGANPVDFVNQPADVSFVIDSMVGLGRDRLDPLHHHVDGRRVAVAGHSLGAVTTLGVTYNSCCADARIDAAISLAGFELPFPDGDYTHRPDTPLLLIHGVLDDSVPVESSDGMFSAAQQSAFYLRLTRANHIFPFIDEYRPLTATTVIAFLDATLKHQPRGLRSLPAAVEASGLGEWRSGPQPD